jgi:hypothetical protein
MEKHTVEKVAITIDDKQIASLPEAIVILNIDEIEVTVNEVLLSNETMGLLGLLGTQKEFTIRGYEGEKSITVEKAKINSLTFDAKKGEPVLLKDISILGLHARWE